MKIKGEEFKMTNENINQNQKYVSELLDIFSSGWRKLSDLHILEIGCGTGDILIPLQDAGLNCYGLDKSKTKIHQIKRRNIQNPPFKMDISDFHPLGIYNYVFSCDGVFSVNGNELESSLDEGKVREVLEKCASFSYNGVLINKKSSGMSSNSNSSLKEKYGASKVIDYENFKQVFFNGGKN